MRSLPKPNTKPVEQRLENNSEPKIFFGILNNSYVDKEVKDNKKFIEYSEFSSLWDPKHQYKFDDSHTALFSKIFHDYIKKAENRIWVIDGYLNELSSRKKFESFVNILYGKMFYIDDIRLFLKDDEHKKDIQEILSFHNEELLIKGRKEIKFDFFNYKSIHDRFAIIDDKLWHFGSDVGSSSRCLNAASYGWDADYFKAINFFTDLWNSKNVK
jgi:hypothetical protein